SNEMNSGASQINTAIQQLDNVIQQNAGASEEMAATAEELSSQADQLRENLSFFKLEDQRRTRRGGGRGGRYEQDFEMSSRRRYDDDYDRGSRGRRGYSDEYDYEEPRHSRFEDEEEEAFTPSKSKRGKAVIQLEKDCGRSERRQPQAARNPQTRQFKAKEPPVMTSPQRRSNGNGIKRGKEISMSDSEFIGF
ncbi:MAG: hypothetical protein LWY06_20115, partial [Firmicutes bacterium]|nr:hypothetical protein [Bacillota bacterium]